jgi:hypothetical protein
MFNPLPNDGFSSNVVRRIRKVRPTSALDPLPNSFSEISAGWGGWPSLDEDPHLSCNITTLDVTFLDMPDVGPVIPPPLPVPLT